MKLNIIPLIEGYFVNEIPFKNPVVAISTHMNISEVDNILKYTTPIFNVLGSSGINSLNNCGAKVNKNIVVNIPIPIHIFIPF